MKFKTNREQIRKFEYLLGGLLLAVLVTFYGLNLVQTKLGNWIYQEYTQPFLAQTPYIVQR